MPVIVYVLETCGSNDDTLFYTSREQRTFPTAAQAFGFMLAQLHFHDEDLRFLAIFITEEEVAYIYNEDRADFKGDSCGHPGKHEIVVWEAGEEAHFTGFVTPGDLEADATAAMGVN